MTVVAMFREARQSSSVKPPRDGHRRPYGVSGCDRDECKQKRRHHMRSMVISRFHALISRAGIVSTQGPWALFGDEDVASPMDQDAACPCGQFALRRSEGRAA